MKKLLSLALAIVIALSMAACGGGNSVSTGTTSAPAASDSEASGPKASGTITVYGWGSGSELEAHKQIVEDFNALNTGVKANLEIVPSTEYSTKLKAMLAAGTAPDVIMTGVDDNHFYYLNNNFEDLSPYIERDSFDLEGIFTPGRRTAMCIATARVGVCRLWLIRWSLLTIKNILTNMVWNIPPVIGIGTSFARFAKS